MATNANTKTHDSYWSQKHPIRKRFEPLRGTHRSDVAIIGGGITGLTTAIELLEAGHIVAVYESQVIGSGTTGGSTGHLDAHPEMGAEALVKSIGVEDARAYVRWRQEAIDTIRRQVSEPCDFKNVDAFYYSETDDDEPQLRRSADAATQIGLEVAWADRMPIAHAGTGFYIRQMARIDILAYLHHLANLVIQAGGQIYEQSFAIPPEDYSTGSMSVGDGTAEFNHLVIAVHCNFTEATRIDLQLVPCQSYAMVARIEEAIPDVLMWDNADPYFYTRRTNSKDPHSILVGGCDHRTGTGEPLRAMRELKSYVNNRYTVKEINAQWSAELFEPIDRLPIIGRVPGEESAYLVTGLSGVGLTEGTGAARLIADLIDGEDSALVKRFSPSRFSLSQIPKMAVQQRQVMSDYAERVLPSHEIDESDLEIGEGAVGMIDGEHIAVCKDHNGEVHRCSPICKHAGGVVRWNAAAQTWDCPVHGGRYAANGDRLYGPPIESLDQPSEQAAKP
jgi:glycine/D-amino acid oxidase-like deaminating enzyme/nitrite reductase/ring-hydroxylating ferredoxin subunit